MNAVIFEPMVLQEASLAEGQIDVWAFSLLGLPAAAMGLLNAEEQQRARRFHFERHTRQFMVARATMRWVLGHYLQEPPEGLYFKYNAQGKPYLRHPVSIQFNLSHSGEQALLAVGSQFPMGIDIEYYSEREYTGIAKQIFSQSEILALNQEPQALKAQAFFDIWAQKEAFIKATGLGLSYPTEEFTVGLSSKVGPYQIIYDKKHDRYWKMTTFAADSTSAAALCCDLSINRLRKITVNPQQLIQGSY